MKQELPDVQIGFRKGRGTRNQIANIRCIIENTREFQRGKEYLLLLYWLRQSLLWITTNCGTFFKRWEYQTTLPASGKISMQVKKQPLEPDMEQQTGPKLGKEYIKAVNYHTVYWTYMQSASCRMRVWIKHKLKLRLQGGISITSDIQITPPLRQKVKRNWRSSYESERGEWKSWLKIQH